MCSGGAPSIVWKAFFQSCCRKDTLLPHFGGFAPRRTSFDGEGGFARIVNTFRETFRESSQ
jgi:hypothetical protein